MVRQIIRQSGIVEFGSDRTRSQQSLDFGSEVKRAVGSQRIVKRLDPEPIARDKQFFFVPVPDGEGKHAAQTFDAAFAMLLVQVKNGFSITTRTVNVTRGFQSGAKISVVVDLAVVSDL